MTVVVYDGKTLATDSQMSIGSINTGSITKIFELPDGALGAGAKAERAVEVVCKYDTSCSLPVQSVKIRAPRKKPD